MRQNKTSKKFEARSTYIYYGADGTKYEIQPGLDGVTEMHIAMLHQEDDDEFNGQRREDYHIPVHYQAYEDGEGDSANDRNDYLADISSNPEAALIGAMERAESDSWFNTVWDRLLPRQKELVLKKLTGRTNVDIADEEGVSEAAVRNRLRKIQDKFKNIK